MGGSICVKATVHLSAYLLLCIFPFNNNNNNNKQMHPFTESQWQELELQALIFHHVAAGIPVPSRLILPFKRSFSLDPFSLHLSMNYGRKAEEDPEPWRCKRTDGKKWRCSREAAGESKYCERHKHRGKRCSNKTSKIPFFANPNHNSCSGIAASSSYSPLPLTLYSHPNNSNLSSFLGDATHPFHFPFDTDSGHFNGQNENSDEKRRFLSEGFSCDEKDSSLWSKEKEKVEHCFVFGADLKLQKPMDNVDSKSQEAQNLNPKLNFVGDSWMNSMEEQKATQLSISSCGH